MLQTTSGYSSDFRFHLNFMSNKGEELSGPGANRLGRVCPDDIVNRVFCAIGGMGGLQNMMKQFQQGAQPFGGKGRKAPK